MFVLENGQPVQIKEVDGTMLKATVEKVGKRTVVVHTYGSQTRRKFVLSDGRESGQGYDCAYLQQPEVVEPESLSDRFMESEYDSSAWQCLRCGTKDKDEQDDLHPSICYDCAVEEAAQANLNREEWEEVQEQDDFGQWG